MYSIKHIIYYIFMYNKYARFVFLNVVHFTIVFFKVISKSKQIKSMCLKKKEIKKIKYH